jgi:hypothetical protein
MRKVVAANTREFLGLSIFVEGVSRKRESPLLDIVLFVLSFFGIHNVYVFS